MAQQPLHIYHDIVRFEDVDAAAIVYHPMYLTYLERARSQSLMDIGYSFKRLLDEDLGMVIAGAEMKYIRPLRLEDRFVVATQVTDYGKSIINVTQAIGRNADDLTRNDLKSELRQIETMQFFAHLKLVVISQKTMRPMTIPDWLMNVLSHGLPTQTP